MKRILLFLLVSGVATPSVFAASADSAILARLERLERRVGHITELMLKVEALKQENRRLQGLIEEQQFQMEGIKRKQHDLYLDVDQRIGRLQAPVSAPPPDAQSGGADPVVPPAAGTTDPAVPPAAPPATGRPSSVDPVKEEAAYRAAYDLLSPERRQYKEAIVAFRDFLAKYPDGKLADNAQYWLAEASYVTQDNPSALAEFRKLVEIHPESPKVPGALLKIGYILHATGQLDGAREILQRLVTDYPNSSAADMARTRLERMLHESR